MNTHTPEHASVWRGLVLVIVMSGVVTAITGCTSLGSDGVNSDDGQWTRVVPEDEGIYPDASRR